ncbi:RNase adapter RapZ [Sandarakinorhabdus sp.]|uniref:RNase adapter RapZ n=1 Tax=Sandarakinorhabdus sp. TaxID=1916663 RepID=UPI00286E76A8|nr:RNase adapter RapZ [Sandarakinorhabdus sp.]
MVPDVPAKAAAPTIHATAVAYGGAGVLLLGPSGAGKSDLALRLVAAGWRLVADDRVVLEVRGGVLWASAPAPLAGLLEVRGVGIVPEPTAPAAIGLALDLALPPDRLPDPQRRDFVGVAVPVIGFAAFDVSAPQRAQRAVAALEKTAAWALASHGLAAHKSSVSDSSPPLLIISGMSGAGKSTVLKALEDQGYEAVDNLPLGLVDSLLAADAPDRPLALGIDIRTRAFDAEALVQRIRALRSGGLDIRLVYVDAGDDVLQRRYSQTRRRHPLTPDRPPADGIEGERLLTSPLRRWADLVIDSSDMSVTDLRRTVSERLGMARSAGMAVTIMSFGFAQGLPRDADLVFDVRFLANPHWDVALRPLTGEDPAVAAFVAADPAYAPAVDRITDLIATLLPGYAREGKAFLTIAIGCTGGRHRSVAVAAELALRLSAAGHPAALVHRDVAIQGHDAALLAGDPQTPISGNSRPPVAAEAIDNAAGLRK